MDASRLVMSESFPDEEVTSVRPTRDGQWEVVRCTKAEDEAWQRDWSGWWLLEGKRLQEIHPEWWKET